MRLFGRLNAGWIIKASGRATAVASEIFNFMPYTTVFNATGQPAISLPLHWNETGLPIGMQFVGRLGDEATLFRLAAQLEQAKPWFNRRPAILDELPGS
jgi:amidase